MSGNKEIEPLTQAMEALRLALADVARITIADDCAVISCSLHNIQTAFRTAIQMAFGEGGTYEDTGGRIQYKKNAMQLMNGVGGLYKYIDRNLLERI